MDGVIFDIENDYSLLASDLSFIDSSILVYVCIPFWLDEDVQEDGNQGEDNADDGTVGDILSNRRAYLSTADD